MGSLALALTGVSSTWYVPMTMIETAFAQGTLLGNPNTPKVLFTGPCSASVNPPGGSTVAPSATTNTVVYGPLGTEAQVIGYFGYNSPIHLQWRAFTAICKTAPIYGMAIAAGTTAASDTITITNTATAAATITYICGGVKISVSVASGDTPAVQMAALKAAINAASYMPVFAGAITAGPPSTMPVSYFTNGTNGNFVRHHISITSGATTTISVGAACLVSGGADESYTTGLTTIAGTRYDYIVPGINPAATSDTRVAAISAQIVSQALPVTGYRQKLIVGTPASLSDATTFATAYNKPRNQFVWQKNSEVEPMILAAQMAAVRYNLETGADPGTSYDGYGSGVNDVWNVPSVYAQSDFPSSTDINTALSVGLTPIASTTASTSCVVMSTTAAGADPRIRDTAKVTVVDRFADDLQARYGSQWTRAKLSDDPVTGAKPYPANVCTPDRLKSVTIVPLVLAYRDASLLTNVEGTTGTIASIATGIDPTVLTRINARIPLYVMPLAHQFAALVSEVSSG
jgi:phage tail sheath gpL-like